MGSTVSDPDSPLFIVENVKNHTMRETLYDYVVQRLHQDIASKEWSKIIVRGNYLRTPPARLSDAERTSCISDWHRPTTTIVDACTIAINCFPGQSYVLHYASLIATYLVLRGKSADAVLCEQPPPVQSLELMLASNLRALGHVDAVVFGYSYELQAVHADHWWQGFDKTAPHSPTDFFLWRKRKMRNNRTMAYLTSMPPFWGDLCGTVVHALHALVQPKSLIFLAKAGSLRKDVAPNTRLVTGNTAYLGHDIITWDNALAPECEATEKVVAGHIVTVPSILCETLEWMEKWQAKASWVDCEVGHMAKACQACEIEFGYLSIASDNLASDSAEGLTNENKEEVRAKRQILFDEAESVVEAFLTRVEEGTQ